MEFEGVITALVTPFKDGGVDIDAVARLTERQIEMGVHGLVACGCTGEAATMSAAEDRRVWRTVLEASRGRVPVIAGAGSNDTAGSIEHAREARDDGVDAIMLITPYYNKPTQEGLFQHFRAIADAVNIPVMLYNVPGRTAAHLEPDTVARLSKIENIVALKEASGTVEVGAWVIKSTDADFCVLSGDDLMFLPLAAIGVKGVVSVASNLVPVEMVRMWEAFKTGDLAGASRIYYELLPLYKVLFIETNPIPVKTALALMGLIEEEFRLPLTKISPVGRGKLKKVLEAMELI